MGKEKPIYWVGTSLKDLLVFPANVKQEAGYQLHRVQNGLEPEDWKPFKQVGVGVKEIRISESNNIYRSCMSPNLLLEYMHLLLPKENSKN